MPFLSVHSGGHSGEKDSLITGIVRLEGGDDSEMRKRIILSSTVSLFYLVLNCIVSTQSDFHQIHNDYWDLLFIAKNIDFKNASSLFNLCIPFGYTSLLHFLIRTGSEVFIPIVVNIVFAAVVVFISTMAYTTMMEIKAGTIVAVLVGLFPPFFFYVNQGGADPGATMFFTAGALLFVRLSSGDVTPWGRCFFSGVLMGSGAVFRFHVLAGAVFLVAAFLVCSPEKWRYAILTLLGAGVAYFPQVIISVATGHGIFATKLGATNIYDLMYGINWYKTSTETIPASAVTVISSNYSLFLRKYLYSFAKFFLVTGVIPLTAGIMVRTPSLKKISRMITVFVVLYFGLFSAMLSGRQVLLPFPLTMLCLGFLIDDRRGVHGWRSTRFDGAIRFGTLTGAAGLLLLFLIKDVALFRSIRQEALLSNSVATSLKKLGCTDTRQIYTTDFDLSFRDIPGHIGRFSGGWLRWGAYNYNELFPEVNTSSLDMFVECCHEKKIRYVLLTAGAQQVNREMENLYTRRIRHDDIRFIEEIDRVKIFELLPDRT